MEERGERRGGTICPNNPNNPSTATIAMKHHTEHATIAMKHHTEHAPHVRFPHRNPPGNKPRSLNVS